MPFPFGKIQNTNYPDIDLERDIIENEIALGYDLVSQKYKINFYTIIVSALVFLAILSWFDFAQTAFYFFITKDNQELGPITPFQKFMYAILTTIVSATITTLLLT